MYLHEKIEGLKVKVKNYSDNLNHEDWQKIKNVC